MLTVVDEWTRVCLAIKVARGLRSEHVLDRLADLFVSRGTLTDLRSDNGSAFTARKVRLWLQCAGVETLYIEPGSRWVNVYVESFNGKLRDELLSRELIHTLRKAQVLIEAWREEYTERRPHSSLGYRPPAPDAIQVAARLT
jgi:transposase InsO family protein